MSDRLINVLKRNNLEWDWKSIENLVGLSQPADPDTFVDVGDPEKLQKLNSAIRIGSIVVLRGPLPGAKHQTFQGALRAVASDSDCGMFTDAKKRAKGYDDGKPFLPVESTVAAALRKKTGIWQISASLYKENSAMWNSPCAQVASVTAATSQFWTNICVGIGGVQHIYYSNHSCATREAYLHLCRCMNNYAYGKLPNWKYVTLHPGDTLIAPPMVCIGGISEGVVAVSQSFITPVHLTALELSLRAALNAYLNPLDVKPMLIDWIMSSSAADGLPVGAKQCLWRLLALQEAEDPGYFTDNAPVDVDELWKPGDAVMRCPIRTAGQSKGSIAYEINTDLEAEVAKRLLELVPQAWRASNFFGWITPYSQMRAVGGQRGGNAEAT